MNDFSSDFITAKEKLISGGYTCVLSRGENFYASSERGVKPLVELLKSGADFKDYCAADKVVGKATAFLYVLLRVKALYACVISKPALKVLKEYGVIVEYDNLVENIINRRGDGICPFEDAVAEVDNPKEAYVVVLKKSAELKIAKS